MDEGSSCSAALSRATDLPPAPPGAWEAADARARRVFPSRVAERHGLAPFALDGRELSLVATYPVDLGLLDEISFMLSLHLTAHVGPEWRVRALIHRLYGGALDPRFAALAPEAAGGPPAPAPGQAQAALAAAEGAFRRAGRGAAEPSARSEATAGLELELSRRRSRPLPTRLPASPATQSEPLEPLAAALAQALESDDFPWLDEDAVELAPAAPPGPPAAKAAPPAAPARPSTGARRRAGRWSRRAPRWRAPRTRDDLVVVALRYARDFFEFAAVFAVTRDAVAGHDALGARGGRPRPVPRHRHLHQRPGHLPDRHRHPGPVPRTGGRRALRATRPSSPGWAAARPDRAGLPGRAPGPGRLRALRDNGEAPVSARPARRPAPVRHRAGARA